MENTPERKTGTNRVREWGGEREDSERAIGREDTLRERERR